MECGGKNQGTAIKVQGISSLRLILKIARELAESFAVGSVFYAYLSPSENVQIQLWACVASSFAIIHRLDNN